jgi:CRISPR-associated protein Csm5
MKPFLTSHRLFMTPLSPIHIGCGEDFEPTNYVIEDGVLYGFDPSRAVLTEVQRSKLLDAANRASLLALQRFFREHASVFKPLAQVLIPVSPGVASKYEQDIGRAVNHESNGNQVFNRFVIERATHTGAQAWPYVPGSSFKGCLRTTLLDELNQGQRITRPEELDRRGAAKGDAVERRLLQGDFATSPLRLLKVADFMPTREPQRRVLYAVNHKKKRVIKDGREVQPKGIAARKESILQGQYRSFVADVVLPSLDPHTDSKLTPAQKLRPRDLTLLAHATNRYHLARLRREMEVLVGRDLVHRDWQRSIEQLLAGELGRRIQAGLVMLVRLGRYGGAESKTLSGAGVAQIKIMQGRGMTPVYMDTTKTVWLAAEHENDLRHMLPFGWAVVEIDPAGDLPELQAWCEQQTRGQPDMVALRAGFEAEKAAAVQRKSEQAALAAARAAQAAAEQAAAEARAQALQTLTPHMQAVMHLIHQCEALKQKIDGGNFKKQAPDPGRAGIYQDATKLVKGALDSPDWTPQEKSKLADMLEQCLPWCIHPWDTKEQRRKLRFAALRGQA